MSETYIVTAKTVEEAMAVANREYGGAGKDISFDILEMPKKGFLGIGVKEAKIKVTVAESEEINLGSIVAEMKGLKMQTAKYDDEEEKPVKKPKQEQPKPEHTKKEQTKPEQPKQEQPAENKPKVKPEAKPAPKAEVKPEAKPAPKAEAQPVSKPEAKPEQPAAPVKEAKPENKPEVKPMPVPKPVAVPEEIPEAEEELAGTVLTAAETTDKAMKTGVTQAEMDYALAFTNTLLNNMQLDAVAQAASCPPGEEYESVGDANVYPAIEITGDGTGILIGHHGETLDAIQYLLNLASIRRSGHNGGDYVKISLDIENYRSKREETLRALARRMAQRALKYKRNVFLEPMNAYERRIIHSELQDVENISTHSVGTDKNRKIIITYEGSDKAPNDRNRRNRRNGKAEATVETPAAEVVEVVENEGEAAGEAAKPAGNRSRNRNRHRSRHRSERPNTDRQDKPENADKQSTETARAERPRPPKPQKLPIEALPDFLVSAEEEPAEHLREM